MIRRHSFPPLNVALLNKLPLSIQIKNQQDDDEDRITVLGPIIQIPLTEENLALHTKNFPPSKDARRRNTRLFVQDQISIILMQIKLDKQRIQEIESLLPTNLQEIVITKKIQIQCDKHTSWLQRFKRKKWIRFLIRFENKHPITVKYHKETCQKRDSGISFFSNHGKRRSSANTMKNLQQMDDFIAYKYPKMIRKDDFLNFVTI